MRFQAPACGSATLGFFLKQVASNSWTRARRLSSSARAGGVSFFNGLLVGQFETNDLLLEIACPCGEFANLSRLRVSSSPCFSANWLCKSSQLSVEGLLQVGRLRLTIRQ